MNSNLENSYKKINNSARNVFNLNLSTISNKNRNIKNLKKAYLGSNNNTITNFTKKRKSRIKSKPKNSSVLNRTIKLNTSRGKTPKKIMFREKTDINNRNTENNLSNLISRINFKNLDEYYKIESDIFMKKIQKLNLKFYYTSEILLKEKNLKYPYDELFLILFKEISLYMEEIERLNKQLLLKTKNEVNFNKKIQKLEQYEKNNALNKQNLKKLQNKINILKKENENYINKIDKLNKKLNYYNTINKCNINNNINYNINNNISNSNSNSDYGIKSLGNSTLDSFNSPQKKFNILSSGKKDINKKEPKIEINEIIKYGIKQCSDEINNLIKIEKLLMDKMSNKYNNEKKI